MHLNFLSQLPTTTRSSISPVLFTIYLEKALREIRLQLDQNIKPNDKEYADDVDFVSTKNIYRSIFIDKIKPTTKKYNLTINKDKTEYVKLKRDIIE